jgi:outer membrane receptor protein involved in Fe transport
MAPFFWNSHLLWTHPRIPVLRPPQLLFSGARRCCKEGEATFPTRQHTTRSRILAAGLVVLAVIKGTLADAQTAETSGNASYPASYFADGRPNTAFDMIGRLPGFTFDGGDPTVRGLDGASGNVLIDGHRPASKTDSLAEILARIPASSVLRIELIHGSMNGIDMQGRSVVANVVRRPEAVTEIVALSRLKMFSDGRGKPAFKVDVSEREGSNAISGSIYAFTDESDDNGNGHRIVQFFDGTPATTANVRIHIPDEAVYLRGGMQHELFGGLLLGNISINYETVRNLESDARTAPPSSMPDDVFRTADATRSGELSLEYSRALGHDADVKSVVLLSLKYEPIDSTALQSTGLTEFSVKPYSGESIVNTKLSYRDSDALSFQAGGEGAYNFLHTTTEFFQNGVPFKLPNANVEVEETRAEIFATAVWRVWDELAIDAGLRVELSTISERGDSKRSESFLFVKPRMLLTWTPNADDQVHLHVEHLVGQLDFNEFAASANLAGGQINAGNANLRPAHGLLYELTFEHHFWTKGALVLTLARFDISDKIDQVSVRGFNAPGNIGRGYRQEIDLDSTVPLDRLGLSGGLLTGGFAWILSSHVVDPTTGAARFISGDVPFQAKVSLTGDVPLLKSTWTVGFVSGNVQRSFRIDEIDRLSYRSLVNFSWLYQAAPDFSVSLSCNYVPERRRDFVRTVFAGLRNHNSVAFIDALSVNEDPWIAVELRRTL